MSEKWLDLNGANSWKLEHCYCQSKLECKYLIFKLTHLLQHELSLKGKSCNICDDYKDDLPTTEYSVCPPQLDPHLAVWCMILLGRQLLSLFWLSWLCLMEVQLQFLSKTRTLNTVERIVQHNLICFWNKSSFLISNLY